jgi:predicted component of viral defense system (DUF524 family)
VTGQTPAPTAEVRFSDGRTVLRLFGPTKDEAGPIREGTRYDYELHTDGRAVDRIEPRELFRKRRGSVQQYELGVFTPGNVVGHVEISVSVADGSTATADLQVFPAKLRYDTEYRVMLEQIADASSEAILQSFAPAADAFVADPGSAQTDFATYALLEAHFRDEEFQAALDRIRMDPHHAWVGRSESRRVGTGLRVAASVAPAFARGGPRVPRPDSLSHLPLTSLPRTIEVERGEDTHDTLPNRFVRFAIERWRSLAEAMRSMLSERTAGRRPTGPEERGIDSTQRVIDRCDEVLAHPLFRQVGPLRESPAANQVLLRRPGYRQVLRAAAVIEASLRLAPSALPDENPSVDPFRATQRNVATLYEYWCFLQIRQMLESVLGPPASSGEGPFAATGDRLHLVLRSGNASRITWRTVQQGRRLQVDLWFNRTFDRSSSDPVSGSWSGRLRPDISVRLQPEPSSSGETDWADSAVWVHFDAKYRIDRLRLAALDELPGDTDAPVDPDDPASETAGTTVSGAGPAPIAARREDLLVMHAYRDAIRRTAGAYILYPGEGEHEERLEYREILPGLGAFPLRPVVGADAAGSGPLREFVTQLLGHVANQASNRERVALRTAGWVHQQPIVTPPVDFLTRPPADTRVLVGYVQRDQLGWVERKSRYNLRAGDRKGAVGVESDVLSAEVCVLWTTEGPDVGRVIGVYRRSGPWEVQTAVELIESGYPPRDTSNRYVVTRIDRIDDPLPLGDLMVNLDTREKSPQATTWAKLTARRP